MQTGAKSCWTATLCLFCADDMNWNALEWDRAAEELTWERVRLCAVCNCIEHHTKIFQRNIKPVLPSLDAWAWWLPGFSGKSHKNLISQKTSCSKELNKLCFFLCFRNTCSGWSHSTHSSSWCLVSITSDWFKTNYICRYNLVVYAHIYYQIHLSCLVECIRFFMQIFRMYPPLGVSLQHCFLCDIPKCA